MWPEDNEVLLYCNCVPSYFPDKFQPRQKQRSSAEVFQEFDDILSDGLDIEHPATYDEGKQFSVEQLVRLDEKLVELMETVYHHRLSTVERQRRENDPKYGSWTPHGWHMGWYSALDPITEEPIYDNNLTGFLNARHTLRDMRISAEERLGKAFITKFDLRDLRKSIRFAYTEVDELKRRAIAKTFKHHQWDIVRSASVSDADAEALIERVDLASRALDEFGCRHLLYGRILLTKTIQRSSKKNKKVQAHWVSKADEIQASAGLIEEPSVHGSTYQENSITFGVFILIHEIAHRHWFQCIDERTKLNFAQAVSSNGKVVVSPSEYGLTSVSECFAEWFAHYASGYRGAYTRLARRQEEMGGMTRNRFRALAGLSPDGLPDSYVPRYGQPVIVRDILELPEEVVKALVTLVATPAFEETIQEIRAIPYTDEEIHRIMNTLEANDTQSIPKHLQDALFSLTKLAVDVPDSYPLIQDLYNQHRREIGRIGPIANILLAVILSQATSGEAILGKPDESLLVKSQRSPYPDAVGVPLPQRPATNYKGVNFVPPTEDSSDREWLLASGLPENKLDRFKNNLNVIVQSRSGYVTKEEGSLLLVPPTDEMVSDARDWWESLIQRYEDVRERAVDGKLIPDDRRMFSTSVMTLSDVLSYIQLAHREVQRLEFMLSVYRSKSNVDSDEDVLDF